MLKPEGFTIFCEDIREEASGQYSYIGIYNGTLYAAQFPARVRSLYVIVNLRQVEAQQAKTVDVTIEFPNDVGPVSDQYDIDEVRKRGGSEGEDGIFALQIHAQFLGIPLKHTGLINVTGAIDGVPCQFGSLRVRLREDND